MHDAFISYSSTDSAEAYSIRDFLQRNGCTCWMAPDNIPAGSDYATAIPKAIVNCKTFVLILSPDAQNSNWVRKELGKAIDKGTVVIPFMIRNFKLNDTFDFLLENAQWCHAYTNRDAALKKLLDAVKAQQSTYRYTPQSTATPQGQTTTQPKQTASAPKATSTAPKSSFTYTSSRSSASSHSRAFSVIIYSLMVWGLFWSLTLLLVGVSYFLANNTAMGSGAFVIVSVGMVGIIILLSVLHKKERIEKCILGAKRGDFLRKIFMWLILTAGIFFTLILIGGMTYLQITSQDEFTPNQVLFLAAGSCILSLFLLTSGLKKYR